MNDDIDRTFAMPSNLKVTLVTMREDAVWFLNHAEHCEFDVCKQCIPDKFNLEKSVFRKFLEKFMSEAKP